VAGGQADKGAAHALGDVQAFFGNLRAEWHHMSDVNRAMVVGD
jgi:hypothetical protein